MSWLALRDFCCRLSRNGSGGRGWKKKSSTTTIKKTLFPLQRKISIPFSPADSISKKKKSFFPSSYQLHFSAIFHASFLLHARSPAGCDGASKMSHFSLSLSLSLSFCTKVPFVQKALFWGLIAFLRSKSSFVRLYLQLEISFFSHDFGQFFFPIFFSHLVCKPGEKCGGRERRGGEVRSICHFGLCMHGPLKPEEEEAGKKEGGGGRGERGVY